MVEMPTTGAAFGKVAHWLVSQLKDVWTACKDASELFVGGITIRGPFPSSDERYVFQTLVQADGDLCLSIHKEALRSSSLKKDIQQHIEYVQRRLATLTWALRNLYWVVFGVAFVLVAGGRFGWLAMADKAVKEYFSGVTVFVWLLIAVLAPFRPGRFLILRSVGWILRRLACRGAIARIG